VVADQYYVEGGQARRRATNRWSNVMADCEYEAKGRI